MYLIELTTPEEVALSVVAFMAVVGAAAWMQVMFGAYVEGMRRKSEKKRTQIPCAFSGCRCHKRDDGPACEHCETRKAVIEEMELYRLALIAEAKDITEKVFKEAAKN